MNRSYNKIRHIQNSNILLERRYLVEQTEPTLIDQINGLAPGVYIYDDNKNEENDKGIYDFKIKGGGTEVSLNFSSLSTPMGKMKLPNGNVEDREYFGWKLDSITTSFIVVNQQDLNNQYDYEDYFDIKPNSNVLVSNMSSDATIPIVYITSDDKIFVGKISKKNNLTKSQ